MFAIRKAVIILGCLFGQLLFAPNIRAEAPKPLSPTELNVLAACMQHLARSESDPNATLLWNETMRNDYLARELEEDGWDVEHHKAREEKFTDRQWEAIDDALKSKLPRRAIKLTLAPKTWSLMDHRALVWKDDDDKEKYWAEVRRKLPAARNVVELFNPGISRDTNAAFVRVVVTPTEHGCARGKMLFLGLQGTAWSVEKEIDTWIE